MKEALFYQKLSDQNVKCILCPHNCSIKPGNHGICRTRENHDGILYAMNYAESAVWPALDPVEKKPLFHFYPGKDILSLGPNTCNLKCMFCQNWNISQTEISTKHISPEELVKIAMKDSIGIAYTYTEPFMWYEFIMETAPLAKAEGLKNVLVTNGFINEEPLKKLLPYIDAFNIDIKSMDENFYLEVCKGKLSPILKTCETVKKHSWIEITNLIIPTLNDSIEKIEKLTDWIAENLGKDTPLHFSRYHPQYKMDIHSTSESTLKSAYEIAKKKLYYVYIGNIFIMGTENTNCPKCGNLLIERTGYNTNIKGVTDSKCSSCGRKADIVGL